MIDLLKKDTSIGDRLTLYLVTGQTIIGTIIELGDSYVLIDDNGVKKRYFPQMIGGWEITSEPKSNPNRDYNKLINELVYQKHYDKAFDFINQTIQTEADSKQKSSLLLRRAQLYSSLNKYTEAISSYNELITFNENIGSPANNMSHLYTELARLLLLVGLEKDAKSARDKAVSLNPNNKIARRLKISGSVASNHSIEKNSVLGKESSSFKVVSFCDEKLIENDIIKHEFIDPEIRSLNGKVTDEIAHRLLDSAKHSDNMMLYLECAKALKSLPAGSYNIQDYEDAAFKYNLLKCRSLYASFVKIILEANGAEGISAIQLCRLKDCTIDYYFEAIESIIDEDILIATSLLNESLKIELSSYAIVKKHSTDYAKKIFDSNNVIDFVLSSKDEQLISTLILSYSYYSNRCQNLWLKLLSTSLDTQSIIRYLSENEQIKKIVLDKEKSTKAIQTIDVNSNNFLLQLLYFEQRRLRNYYNRFKRVSGIDFNVNSIDILAKHCKGLHKQKYVLCLNSTDRRTVELIYRFISNLKPYHQRDKNQQDLIISNAIQAISEIIEWNANTTTLIGRFYFFPLLSSWNSYLIKLTEKKEEIPESFLSVFFDPPYFEEHQGEKSINVTITNKSNRTAEGYRLAIWYGKNTKNAIVIKKNEQDILPGSQISNKLIIPKEKWGDRDVYELFFSIGSRYMGVWSKNAVGGMTLTRQRNILFSKREIKWKEKGEIKDDLFKGRDEIVQRLKNHYTSQERYYSYVLYGLSRTGKSCILKHLKSSICGTEIKENDNSKFICPIYVDLGAIDGVANSFESFWNTMYKTFQKETLDTLHQLKIESNISLPKEFDQFIHSLNDIKLHPLFLFDEFSTMKSIIEKQYMNASFLRYMRKLAVDDDLANFLFAGTYDIKQLIHDQKYSIAGTFVYLREPKKPVFEISKPAAEELMQVMHDKLMFTAPAIDEIHRLTGDVPFWIQKLCINCAFYAVENNKPDIGSNELDIVVRRLTGESSEIVDNTSICPLQEEAFIDTQILESDSPGVELILTTIAWLMYKDKSKIGISYERMKTVWTEYGLDDSEYGIKECIKMLLERRTLSETIQNELHYYKFSLDIFRRWWYQEHSNIELELSSFKTIKNE